MFLKNHFCPMWRMARREEEQMWGAHSLQAVTSKITVAWTRVVAQRWREVIQVRIDMLETNWTRLADRLDVGYEKGS